MTDAPAQADAPLGLTLKPRRRWRGVGILGGIATVIVGIALLVANALVVGDETKPAAADIGWILRLPGGRFQVRTDGPAGGSPIVLIHRFASSMREWDRITPILARDHRVIRVDGRVGRSGVTSVA